jgi:hypothetical protein
MYFFKAYLKEWVQRVAAISNVTLMHNIIQMQFRHGRWPLHMQGTVTEESGVRDGGEEGCYCPNREKIGAEKMQPFIH